MTDKKVSEEKESLYKEGFELYRQINLIFIKKMEFVKKQQFEQAAIFRDEQISLENLLHLVTHEIDRKVKHRPRIRPLIKSYAPERITHWQPLPTPPQSK
jgi:protein-arginine kinase activator protein McsA